MTVAVLVMAIVIVIGTICYAAGYWTGYEIGKESLVSREEFDRMTKP